jgi:hypothetical protein
MNAGLSSSYTPIFRQFNVNLNIDPFDLKINPLLVASSGSGTSASSRPGAVANPGVNSNNDFVFVNSNSNNDFEFVNKIQNSKLTKFKKFFYL